MAFTLDLFAVCSHTSVSVFLFHGLRKGSISGLSSQTVVSLFVCSVFTVVRKMWWPVNSWLRSRPININSTWALQFVVCFADALFLMASAYMVRRMKPHAKGNHDKDGNEIEDDFGKKLTNHCWYTVAGVNRAPPTYLHWGLIYLGALFMSFIAAWASVSFSFAALGSWATKRPTGLIATFENLMRGSGLLPQLHVSQKQGVVSPALALWIALLGAVNIVELISDGAQLVDLCYIAGDVFSLVLVSDFLWIFFKSRLKGEKFVEIPMYYEA